MYTYANISIRTMAVFNFRKHILKAIFVDLVVLQLCFADSPCVCSTVSRLPVYELDYTGSLVIGYIRANECKPSVSVRFLQMKNDWMAVVIEQKLGFVQTNSDVIVKTCMAATNADDGYLCPNSRHRSTYSSQTRHCYEYVDDLKGSRDLAEVYCNQIGGDLLSVTSVGEQEFIFQFLKDNGLVNQPFWTGLLATHNTTRWSDGSTTAYLQPHLLSLGNNNSHSQCGVFKAIGRDGIWNYSDCSLPQAFICKYAEANTTSTETQIQTPSTTSNVALTTQAIPTSKPSTTVTTTSTTKAAYIATTSPTPTNPHRTTEITTAPTQFTKTQTTTTTPRMDSTAAQPTCYSLNLMKKHNENIALCPQTHGLMKHTSLLGYCYEFVVHSPRMCAMAELYCNIHGGNLLSVVSSMEEDYLYQIIASNGLMNTQFCTGLSVSSNGFKWSDGASVSHVPFLHRNSSSPDRCFTLEAPQSDLHFCETSSWTINSFICKYPEAVTTISTAMTSTHSMGSTDKCPDAFRGSIQSGDLIAFAQHDTSCYTLLDGSYNWQNAQYQCNLHNGHVLTMEGSDKTTFVNHFLLKYGIHQEVLTYSNSASVHVHPPYDHCGILKLQQDGTWLQTHCRMSVTSGVPNDIPRRVICEIDFPSAASQTEHGQIFIG